MDKLLHLSNFNEFGENMDDCEPPKKRFRKRNFSSAEILQIVQFYQEHKLIFQQEEISATANFLKREKWQEITDVINSQNPTVVRTLEEVRQKYQNVQQEAKREWREIKKCQQLVPLSCETYRIICQDIVAHEFSAEETPDGAGTILAGSAAIQPTEVDDQVPQISCRVKLECDPEQFAEPGLSLRHSPAPPAPPAASRVPSGIVSGPAGVKRHWPNRPANSSVAKNSNLIEKKRLAALNSQIAANTAIVASCQKLNEVLEVGRSALELLVKKLS